VPSQRYLDRPPARICLPACLQGHHCHHRTQTTISPAPFLHSLHLHLVNIISNEFTPLLSKARGALHPLTPICFTPKHWTARPRVNPQLTPLHPQALSRLRPHSRAPPRMPMHPRRSQQRWSLPLQLSHSPPHLHHSESAIRCGNECPRSARTRRLATLGLCCCLPPRWVPSPRDLGLQEGTVAPGDPVSGRRVL
jgi:hypothetical protein